MSYSAETLLFELSGRILRELSDHAGMHFQGISQGARFLKNSGRLSSRTASRLIKIDHAHHLMRHITKASVDNTFDLLVSEITSGMTGDTNEFPGPKQTLDLIPDDKKPDEKPDESCSVVLTANADAQPELVSDPIVTDEVVEDVPDQHSDVVFEEVVSDVPVRYVNSPETDACMDILGNIQESAAQHNEVLDYYRKQLAAAHDRLELLGKRLEAFEALLT